MEHVQMNAMEWRNNAADVVCLSNLRLLHPIKRRPLKESDESSLSTGSSVWHRRVILT